MIVIDFEKLNSYLIQETVPTLDVEKTKNFLEECDTIEEFISKIAKLYTEHALKMKTNERDDYIAYLEKERNRLTKAVASIYQDFRNKALSFFINAKPDDNTRDIFINNFEKYLK